MAEHPARWACNVRGQPLGQPLQVLVLRELLSSAGTAGRYSENRGRNAAVGHSNCTDRIAQEVAHAAAKGLEYATNSRRAANSRRASFVGTVHGAAKVSSIGDAVGSSPGSWHIHPNPTCFTSEQMLVDAIDGTLLASGGSPCSTGSRTPCKTSTAERAARSTPPILGTSPSLGGCSIGGVAGHGTSSSHRTRAKRGSARIRPGPGDWERDGRPEYLRQQHKPRPTRASADRTLAAARLHVVFEKRVRSS